MRRPVAVALCALLFLAGCGAGPSPATETPTVTPVPVPEATTAIDTTVAPAAALDASPTCERAPERVVAVQIAALRYDHRRPGAGVGTVWRFTAPDRRALFGTESAFRDRIRSSAGTLLNATAVSTEPLVVLGDRVRQVVHVRASGGREVTFRWRLERQASGRYDGCWMTTLIEHERDREAGPR